MKDHPAIKLKVLQDRCTHLFINNVDWMQDDPHEVEEQKNRALACYGDVLVAGLGMGIFQQAALANEKITSITTVEISPELVAFYSDKWWMNEPSHEVIVQDFFTFETDKKYDCVYGDIWEAPDQVEVYHRFVEKSLTLVKKGGRVSGWVEEKCRERARILGRHEEPVEGRDKMILEQSTRYPVSNETVDPN